MVSGLDHAPSTSSVAEPFSVLETQMESRNISQILHLNIRTKLAKLSQAMQLLAAGDDTATIPEDDGGNDEIGVLVRAAKKIRSALVCSREFANAAEQERQCLNAAVSNMPIGLSMFDAAERRHNLQ